MKTIEKIKAEIHDFPQLVFNIDGNTITIDPSTSTGFAVWLSEHEPGFTVGFDGWHEEFDHESEALDALAFGLSNRCRLKVTKRGNTDCRWRVERRDGDDWKEDSTTGLLFVPFWKKKSVVYRQNNVNEFSSKGTVADG